MKRKPGRPAGDPQNPRRLKIQVRIGERDAKAIDRKRGDESVSGWVYRLIRRELNNPALPQP